MMPRQPTVVARDRWRKYLYVQSRYAQKGTLRERTHKLEAGMNVLSSYNASFLCFCSIILTILIILIILWYSLSTEARKDREPAC